MQAQTPKKENRENKMGTMPIPKLVLSMSIPIMISMVVQSMYNIVDSIFVARINEAALTGHLSGLFRPDAADRCSGRHWRGNQRSGFQKAGAKTL